MSTEHFVPGDTIYTNNLPKELCESLTGIPYETFIKDNPNLRAKIEVGEVVDGNIKSLNVYFSEQEMKAKAKMATKADLKKVVEKDKKDDMKMMMRTRDMRIAEMKKKKK